MTYLDINDGCQLRTKNTNGSHGTYKPMDGTLKFIKTFQNELVKSTSSNPYDYASQSSTILKTHTETEDLRRVMGLEVRFRGLEVWETFAISFGVSHGRKALVGFLASSVDIHCFVSGSHMRLMKRTRSLLMIHREKLALRATLCRRSVWYVF